MGLAQTDRPLNGIIDDPKDALAFILGGKAVFTCVSAHTGSRITYRVKAKEGDPRFLFASALVGPDNARDYAFVGYILLDSQAQMISDSDGFLRPGKTGNPADVRFRGLAWLLQSLESGTMPTSVEVWHEGRCARCTRRLTDPESIRTGFGPECRKQALSGVQNQ